MHFFLSFSELPFSIFQYLGIIFYVLSSNISMLKLFMDNILILILILSICIKKCIEMYKYWYFQHFSLSLWNQFSIDYQKVLKTLKSYEQSHDCYQRLWTGLWLVETWQKFWCWKLTFKSNFGTFWQLFLAIKQV